jgi:phenylpropionate dioxygenase-like ring-hydroxylating dioxygenase large terminal subunit
MTILDENWQVTGMKRGVTRSPRYDAAALGYEDYWYPVLTSGDLGHKTVALVLFGQKIMFYRDGGKAYAIEDRCPHRGIRLSIGKQEFPGTFSCRYHGWTFDLKTGTLVAALTDGPDSPMCGKIAVRTYPVEERGGLIWIYSGKGEPAPLERDAPEELLRADAVTGIRISERPGDWRYGAENGFDEGHGKYLHRDSIFVTFRHPPAWVHSDVVDEGNGWITRQGKEHAFQSDYPGLGVWPKKQPWKTTKVLSRASIRMPGALRIHFGEWVHFEWYVPTKVGHHRYVQVAVKHTRGLDALLFKLRYWTYLRWLFHGEFNNQDARVVEMMETPPEQLFRPDMTIIGWRKLCERSSGAPINPDSLAQATSDVEEIAPLSNPT